MQINMRTSERTNPKQVPPVTAPPPCAGGGGGGGGAPATGGGGGTPGGATVGAPAAVQAWRLANAWLYVNLHERARGWGTQRQLVATKVRQQPQLQA